MSHWDRYEQAEAQLKSFTRSAVRSKVLLCLLNGEMTAGELEKEMGIRASTILHSVKEMTDADLVARGARGYVLTSVGRIQALLLDILVNTILTLDEHHDFWMTHDMSGIPPDLQGRIGMLAHSKVMRSDPADLLKSHEHFVSALTRSKEIYGVSPIIAPGHAEAISFAVKKGAHVELILTDAILKIVLKENRAVMKALIEFDNFELFRSDREIKVAFTVIDSLLSLGLCRHDGVYDLVSDLICEGDSAREWGMELFRHYRNLSEKVESI